VAFVVAVQVLRVVVMLLVGAAIARVSPAGIEGVGDCGDRVFLRYCVPWSLTGRPADPPAHLVLEATDAGRSPRCRPCHAARRAVRAGATAAAARAALGAGPLETTLPPARPRRHREGHQPWPRHAARAGADRPDVGLAVRLPPRCAAIMAEDFADCPRPASCPSSAVTPT
jgi:hypothetical protein